MKRTNRISPIDVARQYINKEEDPPWIEEGFVDEQIGRGIFANNEIFQGDFLCEYAGEILARDEGNLRDKEPSGFRFFHKKFCYDATVDNKRLGRLANHADTKKQQNAVVKVVDLNDSSVPRLCLFSTRVISPGEEIRYDYGVKVPWKKVPKDQTSKKRMGSTVSSASAPKKRQTSKAKGMKGRKKCPKVPQNICEKLPKDELVPITITHFDNPSNFHIIKMSALVEANRLNEEVTKTIDSTENKKSFTPEQNQIVACRLGGENDWFRAMVNSIDQQQVQLTALEFGEIITRSFSELREVKLEKAAKFPAQAITCSLPIIPANGKDWSKACIEFSKSLMPPLQGKILHVQLVQEKGNYVQLFDEETESVHHKLISAGYALPFTSLEKSQYKSQDNDDDNDDVQNVSHDTERLNDKVENSQNDLENQNNSLFSNEEDSHIKSADNANPVSDDEESIMSTDMEIPAPKVVVNKKVESSYKKGLDKKHVCLFCLSLMPKMSRHLKTRHKSEPVVARILAQSDNAKIKTEIHKLIKEGDYQHNFDTLQKKRGIFIPKYCPRKKKSSQVTSEKDFLPCEFCKASYKKNQLWRHQKYCKYRDPEKSLKKGSLSQTARMLLPAGTNKELFENVITFMKDDDIRMMVETDGLILKFGCRKYENHKDPSNFQNISNKMRELARLLITAKSLTTEVKKLEHLIQPSNWEILLTAVRKTCGYDENDKNFNTPSLALKLGYSLQTCARLCRIEAITSKPRDDVAEKMFSDFLELYSSDYSQRISICARTNLDELKFNKPMVLPLMKDIQKINIYLDEKIEDFLKQDKPEYPMFAQTTLAKLILFNRKRAGEAQKLKISDFQKGKTIKPLPEQLEGLSKFEQFLCSNHSRVELKGKQGRKVAVLLTKPVEEAISKLIDLRHNAGVSKNSNLIFARPGETKTPYRGNDCLKKMSEMSEVSNPAVMQSTLLRKQLATATQAMSMSEGMEDMLAQFMGHDIRVHRKYYRLPDNVLELAKVTKVLHSINTGHDTQQNLDDIQVSENDHMCEESASESEDEDEENKGDNGNNEPSKWTKAELSAISEAFRDNLRIAKCPNKLEIINVQKRYPILAARPWQNVKWKVAYIVRKRRPKSI